MAVSRTRRILGGAVLLLLLLFLGQQWLGYVGEVEYHSRRGIPMDSSITAERRGVLVKRPLLATPRLASGNSATQFVDAWIERRSRVVYRFNLFRRFEPIDGYLMAFRMQPPLDESRLGILFGSDSFASWNSVGRQSGIVYWRQITRPFPDSLRFRLCEHRFNYDGTVRPPAHSELPACGYRTAAADPNVAQTGVSADMPEHERVLGYRERPMPIAPASCHYASLAPAMQQGFALTEPMDLGYPVKSVDKLATRALLEQRRFDALDALFAALRDSVRRDFRLEYRLVDAYDSFGVPIKGLERLLDEWVRARPAGAAARFSRAEHYASLGWKARGTGWLSETSDAQLRQFRQYMERAIADILAGLQDAPCDVGAYEMLMHVARMGADTAASGKLLQQGLKIAPYSFLLRARHMQNLLPSWGGSYRQMDALATQSDSLIGRNPRLRALQAFGIWDRGDELESDSALASALDEYSRAIAIADFWRFRLARGELLARMDRDAEALEDLRRAAVQRPQDPEILNVKAMREYAVGRNSETYAQAEPYLRQAFLDIDLAWRLDPTDDYVRETLAFMRRNIPEFDPSRRRP